MTHLHSAQTSNTHHTILMARGRCYLPRLNPILIKFALLILLIPLAGCAQARVVIEVEEDRSASLEITFGVERTLLGFAQGLRESDVLDIAGVENDEFVESERWIEGDFEWMRMKRYFEDANELQTSLLESDLFENLTITQNRNTIHINGTLRPLETDDDEFTAMFAEGLIDARLLVKMPGEVVETNGVLDRNYDAYSWSILGRNPTTVNLVSELPPRFNFLLILLAVTAVILAIAVVAVVTTIVLQRQNRPGDSQVQVVG